MQTYPAKLAETNEEWNPETTAEVLRKMKARPLPAPSAIGSRKQLRFGLHGIEKPFVQAGADEERTAAGARSGSPGPASNSCVPPNPAGTGSAMSPAPSTTASSTMKCRSPGSTA